MIIVIEHRNDFAFWVYQYYFRRLYNIHKGPLKITKKHNMGKWAKKSCLNMISKDTFLEHNCKRLEYIFLTQIWFGECN